MFTIFTKFMIFHVFSWFFMIFHILSSVIVYAILWLWYDCWGLSVPTDVTQVSIIIALQWLTIAQSHITETSHPYKKKSRRDINLRIKYVIMCIVVHECTKNEAFLREKVLVTHNASIPPLLYNNTLRIT